MNIFATDHPMTAQPSWFDARVHPWLSYVSQILVLALILLPLAAGLVLYSIASADYYALDDQPASIIEFVLFLLYLVTDCLLLAFLCVSVYRLLGWLFRKRRSAT
jgi:hypothetical protein